MGTSNLTEKCIKNTKESAIADHLLQCDSPTNFDEFDTSGSDSNKFKVLVKESLLIKRDNPVLNRATISFALDLFDYFWYLVLTFYKKIWSVFNI